MDVEAELHIDLFNFEDEKYDGSKYILTSPHSLEACSRLGIKPIELLPKQISDFKEEYIPRGLPVRTICAMHREYERERLNKLQLCIEKRQEIVKEEYRQQELSEALDNLHLCSHSDMTSGVNSLDELSDESADEVLLRGNVERARSASALSVSSVSTEELAQRKNNTKLSVNTAGRRKKSSNQRSGSKFLSRSCHHSRDSSLVRPMHRCKSDLGYDSLETTSDVSYRPHVGSHNKLASGIRTVNRTPTVNTGVNSTSKLRAKDWKILSIMSARRADQVNQDKMAEEAHKLWEAEKNQRIRASQAHELQRWQTLAQNRWKQDQQKLELLARREQLEEELKCSRQQQVDRTLQLLAVAAEKQHSAKLQKQDQIQKEEAEKLQLVRNRLRQHCLDEAEYKKDLVIRQQHRMKLALDKRKASEHHRAVNMRHKNELSRQKHEQIYDALRRQWTDDQINLRESVESKLQQTEQQSALQKRRHHLRIQKRQRDLNSKIEQSRLKQQQMEQALAVWCEKLTNCHKIHAAYSEHVAKEAVARKSQTAYTLRSRNEKQQQENIRKIAEREKQWERKMKQALARKAQRVRAVQYDRDKMIAESRALAGASQQMREKLKAAYSVNDFDQRSKEAIAKNKLLFKRRRYVSRYNPGTASTISLG